ncbi:cytochrome c oxidase assembly factor 3, mitochondrial [Ceratina calcarata]|uniref:Cytochrome c oxidase assembly factor 3 n=1 Tax=Ceratina calcarata TaxID=156304 RepID=A0AAJ7WAD7_9HYME|nr:cytochrome c oxidase assembly factor 3, mitochondrial [Ceratina calcarata]
MQSDERSSEFMQKLDLLRDKNRLKYSDLIYMQQAEQIAIERALKYKNTRKRCTVGGLCLGALAIGIYVYTIRAVKQETFLDDLNEPEKIIEKKV